MGATVKVKAKRAKKPYRPKVARNSIAAFETLNRSNVTRSVIREFAVPLCEADRASVDLTYVIPLDRLAHGKAGADELGHLGTMCNVALVLCERDFGAEYIEEIRLAQNAVMMAVTRGIRCGTFGVTGDELNLLRRAYRLHMVQCEVAGRGHLLAAGKEVTRRKNAGDVLKVA